MHFRFNIRSDQISRSVVSDSLRPRELQHASELSCGQCAKSSALNVFFFFPAKLNHYNGMKLCESNSTIKYCIQTDFINLMTEKTTPLLKLNPCGAPGHGDLSGSPLSCL